MKDLTDHSRLAILHFPCSSWCLSTKLPGRLEDLGDIAAKVSICSETWRFGAIHLILVEYLGHVLVQPVEVVTHGEGELLPFRLSNVQSRRSFVCHPGRRPKRDARASHCRHLRNGLATIRNRIAIRCDSRARRSLRSIERGRRVLNVVELGG